MHSPTPEQSPLGKSVRYQDTYDPSLLFPIPRQSKRDEIGVSAEALPFDGVDLWTGFELSWLNPRGKPQVAIATFRIPAHSPRLIESKSFKLYLDIEVDSYAPCPERLSADPRHIVTEVLSSNLLKSNCLVTGQPDWGSVQIAYTGPRIDREGLLRYLIGFRQHNEFHEQCVERIFVDLMRTCQPERLTVYARYTRRGGLDINPLRTNDPSANLHPDNSRTARQ